MAGSPGRQRVESYSVAESWSNGGCWAVAAWRLSAVQKSAPGGFLSGWALDLGCAEGGSSPPAGNEAVPGPGRTRAGFWASWQQSSKTSPAEPKPSQGDEAKERNRREAGKARRASRILGWRYRPCVQWNCLPEERGCLSSLPQFPLETLAWLPFITAAWEPGGRANHQPRAPNKTNRSNPLRIRWDNKPSLRREPSYFFYSVNGKWSCHFEWVYFKAESFEGQSQWSDILAKGRREENILWVKLGELWP